MEERLRVEAEGPFNLERLLQQENKLTLRLFAYMAGFASPWKRHLIHLHRTHNANLINTGFMHGRLAN